MFHKCPPVLIPDTVLLDNKSPTIWFESCAVPPAGTAQSVTLSLLFSGLSVGVLRTHNLRAVQAERVLFIGTEFSILYTSMHSPA
jgi:hypothetical protein